MAIAKKVTAGNHKPGTGNDRFRVYSKQFNALVDVILELEAADGALTPATVAATGSITSSGATDGIGYATGAGGAVTQITSASTGVTLSTVTGQITTVALTTAAGAEEVFTVTNTAVAATDVVVVSTTYAGAGTILVSTKATAAGSFDITITNLHAANALDALAVINFAVIKGVVA